MQGEAGQEVPPHHLALALTGESHREEEAREEGHSGASESGLGQGTRQGVETQAATIQRSWRSRRIRSWRSRSRSWRKWGIRNRRKRGIRARKWLGHWIAVSCRIWN